MFEKKLIAKFMYKNLYDEDGDDSCVLDEDGSFRFYVEYLEYVLSSKRCWYRLERI